MSTRATCGSKNDAKSNIVKGSDLVQIKCDRLPKMIIDSPEQSLCKIGNRPQIDITGDTQNWRGPDSRL